MGHFLFRFDLRLFWTCYQHNCILMMQQCVTDEPLNFDGSTISFFNFPSHLVYINKQMTARQFYCQAKERNEELLILLWSNFFLQPDSKFGEQSLVYEYKPNGAEKLKNDIQPPSHFKNSSVAYYCMLKLIDYFLHCLKVNYFNIAAPVQIMNCFKTIQFQ